jgi:hypothetical protein
VREISGRSDQIVSVSFFLRPSEGLWALEEKHLLSKSTTAVLRAANHYTQFECCMFDRF